MDHSVASACIQQKPVRHPSSRAICLHKPILSDVSNIVRSNWVPDNKEVARSPTDDVRTTIRQPEQQHFYDTKRYPWSKRYVQSDNIQPTNTRWTPKRSDYSSSLHIAKKYDLFSMSRLRKYDDVVLCQVAKLERSSVDLASSSTHAREDPDLGLLRPQRGARNCLGGSFFHLFQQFFGLFLGCLIL